MPGAMTDHVDSHHMVATPCEAITNRYAATIRRYETMRPAPAAACAIAATLLLGCGPSSSDDDSTPTPAARITTTDVPVASESSSWDVGSPSEHGFDTDALLGGLAVLEAADSNAHGLVVARGGALVIDASFWPSRAGVLHDLASLTKSVVALGVGVAVQRGDVGSLDTVLSTMLDLPEDSGALGITLRDLLGMRSGLECSADEGEAELRAMLESADYVAYASALPRVAEPREVFAYCSPGYHLVSAAMTAATGSSLADYVASSIFEPLGIDEWSWPSDPQGISHGWGDLALQTTDVARIGQLVLDDGLWGSTRILPEGFVESLSADAVAAGGDFDYGLGWWLPNDGDAGSLEGIGRGGQELLVWPERDLVVVVTGAETDGRLIARTVAAAISDTGPRRASADDEIAARFAALALPPEAAPPSAPDRAASLGTPFTLDPNPLGASLLVVESTDPAETLVKMTVGGVAYDLPVGLDGVARLVDNAPGGGSAALTGTWEGAVLSIDYEATSGPDHSTFALDLGEVFTMTVTDLAARTPPMVVTGSPTA